MFVVLVCGESGGRVFGRRAHRFRTETGGDGEIYRERKALLPPRYVHICGPSCCGVIGGNAILWQTAKEGPRLEKPWLFQLGVEPGTLCEVVNQIALVIVAASAVPTVWTNEAVITELVQHSVAAGANSILWKDWRAKPALDCKAEQKWLGVVAQVG